MPTPTKGPRLGGGPAHERLLLANLATQLFTHKSITTTQTRAKRMQPLAERMITFAKRGDLSARRRVLQTITDKGVVHTLFTEIAPVVSERKGGYTRITKIGNRKGDNAAMVVIELVLEPLTAGQATVREAEAATARASRGNKAVAAEQAAEDTATEAENAKVEGDAEGAVDAAAETETAAAVADDAAPGSDEAKDAKAASDLAEEAADDAVDKK
ncbi:hypothetical protein Kisp01_01910 [Kineosporia sp. NBRC 101677]|uniref:50S ribosomal protein L17 n=1 Tax=Kineosporia TaxID=49184 RepID=UPI0024A0D7F9|nr:50S ribosomal protein L17 [Kineosporia sp. NBRC 101677]GLY13175.1 hypothetical protein Kisp01_01910 [Kineosporia sp. NBRC 101677]